MKNSSLLLITKSAEQRYILDTKTFQYNGSYSVIWYNSSIDEFMINAIKKTMGRRPGLTNTKEVILRATQKVMADLGYERATIRSIASNAGVDPALVLHYFKTKHELFLAAMLPTYQGPALLAATLKDLPRQDFGKRMSELFCYVMENKQTHMMLMGMVRAAASEPKAAKILQSFIEQNIIVPIAQYIKGDNAELRANLIGSHIVGLFVTRYIAKLEPLASASTKDITSILAPVIQKYLNE